MVLISLVSVLNLLYFYISTFRSMCAVPNVAVLCSFIIIIVGFLQKNAKKLLTVFHLCVCVGVCIYICVCVYVCVYVRMYVYIYIYTHVCICMWVCTFTYKSQINLSRKLSEEP